MLFIKKGYTIVIVSLILFTFGCCIVKASPRKNHFPLKKHKYFLDKNNKIPLKSPLLRSLERVNPQHERFIVVVIPSYNNKHWYAINLASVLSQKYSNYHVIYIDDCSTDGTGDLVEKYIKENHAENKVTLIRNKERLWMAANRYNAIHSCPDYAIIANLDGDDWWLTDEMLSIFNKVYENSNVWVTYGQFINWPTNLYGYGQEIPQKVVSERSFRSYKWAIGQSRTFYAWLFKQIKKEDFMVDGKFIIASTDVAMMTPIMEMVGDKFKFIPDVLYMRNVATDLNVFKVARATQKSCYNIVHKKSMYSQIKQLPFDQLEGILRVDTTKTAK